MEDIQELKNPDFRVSEQWRYLYDTLCRRGKMSRELGCHVFEKYTQLYSLAAVIGYTLNRRKEVKGSYTPFTLNEIERDSEWPTLRAIAWKASGCDLSKAIDKRATIKICDEFSEGGIEYLYQEFFIHHTKDGHLLRPQDISIEQNLSLILKGIKEEVSNQVL